MCDVCRSCDEDPPRAVDGPDRSYEPSGGLPTYQEIAHALRVKIGDEAFDRESRLNNEMGRATSRALTTEECLLADYDRESARRRRTRSWKIPKQRAK